MAAALSIAACNGDPVAIPAAPSDPKAEPTPTADPWPQAFEDGLCLAIGQIDQLVEDMNDLSDAAAAGDADAVSLQAYVAGTTIQTMDLALQQIAKLYQPARPMLVAWRKANATAIKALDDLDRGADRRSTSLIKRGAAELRTATKQIDKVPGLQAAFTLSTGFACS